MNWKEIYTKLFLKQANRCCGDSSVKEMLSVWWQNTRAKDEGGLRLTNEGYRFITEEIDVKVYEIPYPKDTKLTANTVIWLDQFINCPYYLTDQSIFVTNEKKAVELTVFSGDVRKYGLAKTLSNRQKNS